MLIVSDILNNFQLINGYKHKIVYLGQNTIITLYLHRLFDGLDKSLLYLLGIEFSSKIFEYLYFGIMTVLFIIISYYPIKIINKSRMRYIFGKR